MFRSKEAHNSCAWVKSRGPVQPEARPLYSRKRTSEPRTGMSDMGQLLTHAPQQIVI